MAREVRAVIRTEHSRSRLAIAAWVLAAILIAVVLGWLFRPQAPETTWRTEAVDRGDMVLTATATGNLAPKREVSVGAEISGLIAEVLVTENDAVARGDVLARFDTEELEVNLAQAEARLALAQASVAESDAGLEQAGLNERRIEEVVGRGLASTADLDSVRIAREQAAARLASARAAVREAEAAVSAAQTRLDKAIITSPIDGVVLQRNVEPGNAVAANFQTPQLFLLAEDLGVMELQVSLDEADVGLVAPGQPATFSVDAWPDETFAAEVLKVYLYPTVENNVVTYTALLGADNGEGRLRPGMTATATITTGTRTQVLRVPNVALRFSPPDDEPRGGIMLGPPGMGQRSAGAAPGNTLWVLRHGTPERVLVRTGHTDGRYTEILTDELAVGDEVVTGTSGEARRPAGP
ncbi:MAG: efflux RND transporter periplasmic adaptor subunit [Pseudomonadales bacterium]